MLTAFDTLNVLGLKGRGFRQVEALILALSIMIAGCLLVELLFVHPDWHDAADGLLPSVRLLPSRDGLYLAIGILGATVMPHNLYLHSSIVQTRKIEKVVAQQRQAIKLALIDTIVSLPLALLINGAILVLAAAAFHTNTNTTVQNIEQAYHLLEAIAGSATAAISFAEYSVGRLLIMRQVVLSLLLPYLIYPLIRSTANKNAMGIFSNSWRTT